jgi:hypothetical protein
MQVTRLPPRDNPIWKKWARTDPILADMLRRGQPLTRDQWLRSAYTFDDVPNPLPPETESAMPPPFRLGHDVD